MIEWIVDRPGLRLGYGDCAEYDGDADLVFSHLYGPLPPQLIGKPAIINVFGDKRESAQRWCGADLIEVSKWGRDLKNTIYVANMEAGLAALQCYWQSSPPSLTDLVEDDGGWFPVDLCRRCLQAWHGGILPVTVFDGCMGRGTVGKLCIDFELEFVGIDRDPERVKLAMDYLGC